MPLIFSPGSGRASVGHHFLLGLRPTPDLDEADRRLLAALRPAGVILFRGNFLAEAPYEEWLGRLAGLIASVRECIERDQLLICIDHEGGTVLRPPAPITAFDFARRWRDQAGAVGRAMGVELASLGINVNFAPLFDIDSNPENPVIGPRAFGTTPEEVIGPARELLLAMQAEGVLGCPKHFPGHGDTRTDSHHELPVLDLDLEALRRRELAPYRALLSPEVALVMTAHILFPQLDGARPATMSAAIIHDLLRGELGYDGAVVSDDLGMRAVSRLFERPDAAVETLQAGCDLLMVCQYFSDGERALGLADQLDAAARRGRLDHGLLERSGARIAKLLERAPQHPVRRLEAGQFAAHAAIAPLRPRKRGTVGQTVSLKEE